MIHDAHRFAMDLPASLARTLHGDVKVMITSCSIRHLYALPISGNASNSNNNAGDGASGQKPSSPPAKPSQQSSSAPDSTSFLTTPISSQTKTALLKVSRSLTLRKCNHHILEDPLSTSECLSSVLDRKGKGVNKHHLVLAAQDATIRQWARQHVAGVPSVYVKRSVMVMEPMSVLSERARAGEEKGKLRGLLAVDISQNDGTKKRVREGDEQGEDEGESETKKPKKKRKGPKGPNPLSVKKKKPLVSSKKTEVGGEAA
jgi:U3 small nucleolar RNA-associated protein 23